MKTSYEKKMEMLAEVAAAFDRLTAFYDARLAKLDAELAELNSWPTSCPFARIA
jgi:hypothetical protein